MPRALRGVASRSPRLALCHPRPGAAAPEQQRRRRCRRAPGPTTASTARASPYRTGPTANLIAYGYQLVAHTFGAIGPEVADPAMRFAGNNLACQNCHLDAGTNRTGLPLVGVFKTYPKFLVRDQRVVSLPERLNECMTRSMNGRKLPDDSREMAAFWPICASSATRRRSRTEPAPAAPLPADAGRGAEVFATICAVCHQADGLGKRMGSVNDARGYVFPPLWGPDSFNDGAGMDRYQHIVGFVRRNMPRGVDPQHPQLSLQQAWDVAAYVTSMPRPHGRDSALTALGRQIFQAAAVARGSPRGRARPWPPRTCGGSRPASARGTSAASATTARRRASSRSSCRRARWPRRWPPTTAGTAPPTSSLSSGIRVGASAARSRTALRLGRHHALHPAPSPWARGPHDRAGRRIGRRLVELAPQAEVGHRRPAAEQVRPRREVRLEQCRARA